MSQENRLINTQVTSKLSDDWRNVGSDRSQK